MIDVGFDEIPAKGDYDQALIRHKYVPEDLY
jgi:hypothetical protein